MAILAHLEVSLALLAFLGPFWCYLGSFLDQFWADLGASWAELGPKKAPNWSQDGLSMGIDRVCDALDTDTWQYSKNHQKQLVFACFGSGRGGHRGCRWEQHGQDEGKMRQHDSEIVEDGTR